MINRFEPEMPMTEWLQSDKVHLIEYFSRQYAPFLERQNIYFSETKPRVDDPHLIDMSQVNSIYALYESIINVEKLFQSGEKALELNSTWKFC